MITLLVLVIFSSTAPSTLAADADNAIHVSGQVAQSSEWSADRLKKDFAADMQTVQFTSKGQQHSAKCISLVTLLKRAGVQMDLKMGPKMDPKAKNQPLRMVVVVTGRDGYVTAFSLGELLANVGHTEAWLAVEVDGKPLAAADGPARLIVPSDKMPARWVREVGSITIIDGAVAATQPK